MLKQKLKYTFYNPNSEKDTLKYINTFLIDLNKLKIESTIFDNKGDKNISKM